MTHSDATAAAGRGDCSAQNNLDYLYQFFNGWMQGKNGYDLGTIRSFHSRLASDELTKPSKHEKLLSNDEGSA